MTVYFIRNATTSFVKIGFTAGDARQRMAQLQTGHADRLELIGTIDGDRDVERSLHDEFKSDRQGGEWFRPSLYLTNSIEHLIATGEPWYACRRFRISWEMMSIAWLNISEAHQGIDHSPFEATGISQTFAHDLQSARDVVAAHKVYLVRWGKNKERLQKFKERNGGRNPAWRADIHVKHRMRLEQLDRALSDPSVRYILAWEDSSQIAA